MAIIGTLVISNNPTQMYAFSFILRPTNINIDGASLEKIYLSDNVYNILIITVFLLSAFMVILFSLGVWVIIKRTAACCREQDEKKNITPVWRNLNVLDSFFFSIIYRLL